MIWLRSLNRFAQWLAVAGAYVAAAGILIMTVGLTLDVSVRYIFGAGTKYATELSGYIVVGVVFLGLAYTHLTKGHIEIDFVVKRLSPRPQRWLRLFNSLVFFGYTVLLGYYGWRTVSDSYIFKTTSRTGWDVIVWPYQALIPIGLAMCGLLLAASILIGAARAIRNEPDPVEPPETAP